MSNNEYREAQQQAREAGLARRHETRLVRAEGCRCAYPEDKDPAAHVGCPIHELKYTAAEVKVLAEAALRLGRKEAFEEALGEIQKEARWQTELLNRDNWSQWDQSIDRLMVIFGCIRHLAGDGIQEAASDASSARIDLSVDTDLPQDPRAVRSPQEDA